MIFKIERKLMFLRVLFIINFAVQSAKSDAISSECHSCICKTSKNECLTSGKNPFSISPNYWYDAGNNTLKEESADSQNAFNNCVGDFTCALDTVEGYMKRYAQDCNGDGVIDCFDLVLVHKFGPTGCLTGKYTDFCSVGLTLKQKIYKPE